MKKILVWPVAIITSLVSLIAMCIFDYILSLVSYYISKINFLDIIIESVGEVLDLGLTALAAIAIACSIWKVGHAIIEKANRKVIKFDKSPIFHINNLFFFVFLAMCIVLGYDFVKLIGEVVTGYTADTQGIAKLWMFLKALKDTFVFVRNENIIFYKIGYNSLVLFIININATNFI